MSDTKSPRRADEVGNKAAGAAEKVYDAVVIGAGAGGLNAALVLARARCTVAVVDGGRPRNASAAHMRGFLSRDGTPPADLLEAGRAELTGYGADIFDNHIDRIAPGFFVHLSGGAALRARRIVVATGLRDQLPDLPGVRERWGRDLLHCPFCHGYEVRDQPLGVLGTHPDSVDQALLLVQWSADVVHFPHTRPLSDQDRERLTARGVRTVEGEIKRLAVTDDRLQGVELTDGRVVPRSAAFVFPRMVPNDSLLTELGCAKDERGVVTTDGSGRTSVYGVWAVGNVVDPRAQVVTAAGMGAAAAFALTHDLVDEDIDRALEAHRAAAHAVPAPQGAAV